MAEPSVGELIDGRYEVEALIGRGGMGTVWRARHVFTNVRVALKLIEAKYDAVAFDRFLAEARAASTIGHPAIVEVNDANRMANNQLYLAMELLVGKPLRVAMTTGAIAGDDVRRIGLELLDALGAAHAHGIIHRDLKPENIFLVSPSGAVKVLDFGIAKVLGGSARSSEQLGVLGTVEYMASEQLADASDVDGRADLFAVGIVLYEMLSGQRPFPGGNPFEKYAALMSDRPTPIESLVPATREVTAFFTRALAADRTRRFATAAEMAAALRTLALSANAGAQPSPSGGPTLGTGAQWQKPASLPDEVGPTRRATPRSIPPDDIPLTARPHPNQNFATTAPRAAPQSRRSLLVAMLGVVVVGGGIAIGVLAGSRSSSPITDAGVRDDATVVVPVAGDAVTVSTDRCATICTRLAGCQLGTDTCRADCERKLMLPDCVERAATCVDVSACMWKWWCTTPPTGSGTCSDALKCHQTRCGGKMDNRCLCGCNIEMTPTSGLLMAKLFQCRTNIGEDMDRFKNECSTQFAMPCFNDK